MRKRRRVIRLGLPVRILYTDPNDPDSPMGVLHGRNVSREGAHFIVQFMTMKPLAIGVEYTLELILPWDVKPIAAAGRIAWLKHTGAHFEGGLQFTKLTAQDQERIQSGSITGRGPF